MAKKAAKFPAELLVTREVDGDNVYYPPHLSLDALDDDCGEIATYRLVAVRRLKVTRELV